MQTEVPLLSKAIDYIEVSSKDNQDAFVNALIKCNSSIILMFVISKITELEDKYSDNEKYNLVVKALNEQLNKVASYIPTQDSKQLSHIRS